MQEESQVIMSVWQKMKSTMIVNANLDKRFKEISLRMWYLCKDLSDTKEPAVTKSVGRTFQVKGRVTEKVKRQQEA